MSSFQEILTAVLIAVMAIAGTIIVRWRARLTTASARFDKTLSQLSRAASPAQATGIAIAALESDFGAERVLFFRRHQRTLECNSPEMKQSLLRLEIGDNLVKVLTGSYAPRTLHAIKEEVEKEVWEGLVRSECDTILPLFWGQHVYGLFLLRRTRSTAFRNMTSALAHSLSAIYHLNWQKTKAERSAAPQPGGSVPHARRKDDPSQPARHLLKLIRHKDSDVVVRRLISTAQAEIGLERFVFIYEPKAKEEELQVIAGGIGRTLEVPNRELFNTLASELSPQVASDIRTFTYGSHVPASFGKELTESGITHALLFPLRSHRRGIFLWSDKKPNEVVTRQLSFFQQAASELIENAESFERVEELSQTDPMTGLYNQRYLKLRLNEEINRAHRYNRSLALVMIDVDMLKSVNDSYGHQAGDAVIYQIGRLLRRAVREIDVIARYGGDEFCVVMPEAELATCEQFMARIREWLSTNKLALPGGAADINCTISLGAAVFPDHASDAHQLIFAADMALLKAKEGGRDALHVFDLE